MYEPLTFYLYQFSNYFSGPLLMRFKEATNENLQLRYTHKSFLWNSNFIHLYFSLQNLKSPSLSVELHSRWNKKKTFDPSTSITTFPLYWTVLIRSDTWPRLMMRHHEDFTTQSLLSPNTLKTLGNTQKNKHLISVECLVDISLQDFKVLCPLLSSTLSLCVLSSPL